MAQAILADTFPPQQRGLAFALYGITADHGADHRPDPGRLDHGQLLLALDLLHQSSGRAAGDVPGVPHGGGSALSERAQGAGMRVDYMGIALLTLGVGALQVLLDKGQEDDWFGSHFIITLIADLGDLPGFAGGVGVEFHEDPIIDVRLFKHFNFATANLMMFMLGIMLFSSLVMMPQFLQTLLGYTARSAGLVLSASGVLLLIEMPIMGQLTTKFPAKYIMAFGWLVLALGMYYSTLRIDLLISFRSAMWLRVAQASGLGFLFVPIYADRLYRNAAGERQQRGGYGEFHAQHRQRRRDFHGDHAAGAPGAVSSVRAVAAYHQLRSGVSQPGERTEPAVGRIPGSARPTHKRTPTD